MPEELNTKRLRLRCPAATDAVVIFHSYAQDPQVCRFMIWPPHSSELQTQQFISSCVTAWELGERLPFVIAEQESNLAIGMLEVRVQGTTVDIGYVLTRAHWGKGFMPEAIQSVSFAALGFKHPATLRTFRRNALSKKRASSEKVSLNATPFIRTFPLNQERASCMQNAGNAHAA